MRVVDFNLQIKENLARTKWQDRVNGTQRSLTDQNINFETSLNYK